MRAAVRKPAPRGACPGALRPMQSGDGLIVRVRPRAGAIPPAGLLALAAAADRHGNGEIDLTRRANLQLRGLTPGSLDAVRQVIESIGLLDPSPEAEAIRNIVVSPLAGFDPAERKDMRPVARDLEQRLAADPHLAALPAKFGFLIDGGGLLPLDAERADIRVQALDAEAFALGLDGPDGIRWLGRVAANEAAGAMVRAAALFAARLAPGARTRMRDADAETVAAISTGLALAPLAETPPLRPAERPLGLIDLGAKGVAVGIGAPFGRLTAGVARNMAKAVSAGGASEIFLSPWRALYVPFASRDLARAFLASAARHNLVTRNSDPIARIDACPGAPACAAAAMATRPAARRLAGLLPTLGLSSAHVSGCPKGCARSAPADLVLVAGERSFGVIRGGRADDPPEAVVSETLDHLAARLAELGHG